MDASANPHALAPADALNLAGLVDYQDGAVVSRTIVKGKAGNLTLFAFAAGQELSEHTTPFDAHVIVLDGQVELRIGGDTLTASTGDIVRMPADIRHAVTARERFKMLLVMLKEPRTNA